MNLSRLQLNPQSRQVHHDLASPYELHRTLLRAFPDRSAGGAGRVLYRVEAEPGRGQPPSVLVQSEQAPDWDVLLERGYVELAETQPVRYRSRTPAADDLDTIAIAAGDRFRFRLLANPTVKRRVEGRKNGRRDACLTEVDQLEWLARKASQGGFQLPELIATDGSRIPNVQVTPLGRRRSYRARDRRTLCHVGVRFDGLLEVTDSEQFVATLESGIGSGKAFGFGLLSIARM